MFARLLFLTLSAFVAFAADYTALDKYVASKDSNYKWEFVSSSRGFGYTAFVLNLTSQTWLTTAEVDRPDWRHTVVIVRPDEFKGPVGLLAINGGSNTTESASADPLLASLAVQSKSILVEVRMVPNQPLRFSGESKDRTEDALIAYSWSKFLNTGDDKWPARLPMTKAAIRAMDAASEFLKSERGGGFDISRYVVTGASKRGWTAWTTAIADPRIIGIIPLVIDVLNVEPSFVHHWRAYGFWAPSVKDYEEAGIMNWIGTPQFSALSEIEDPLRYKERLNLPKYIVNASGDQFFLPDSSQFYFDQLPGEKFLRYVPNADHSLSSAAFEVAFNVLAYHQALLENRPRPRFYWRADREAGSITLRTLDTPTEITLWQATNPTARDFRLETIGPAWTSSPITPGANGITTVSVPSPGGSGYTAFFLELKFPSGGDFPFVFTTEVVVTPNTYPFGPPVTSK